jgi:hypothetical protein
MIRSVWGLVFATILLAACVAPAATPSRTPTSYTTPTPSSSTSPTSTPQPSPAALTGWQLVAIPSAVAAGWTMPAAVAAGAGRLVAVGGAVHPAGVDEGPVFATTWTSADGLVWKATDLDPALELGEGRWTTGPDLGLFDVAFGPGGFVALGYAVIDGRPAVAIWRSDDGLGWVRIALPDDVFASGRPAALVAGGPGYVIVGAWLDLGSPAASAALPRAAIWTSIDGRTWSRVPDQRGLGIGGYIETGEERLAGGMLGLTTTSAGLTAVGQTCKAVNLMETMGLVPTCRPLLWTSEDGMTWTRIDPGVTVHLGSVPSIAAVADHIVAVGGAWSQSPARYTLASSDGTKWRWTEEAGVPRFEGIVGAPGTFLATWHDAGQVGMSSSSEGTTWAGVKGLPRMTEGPSVRDSDVVALDDRAVIVGWREGEEDPANAAFAIVGPLETE